MRGVVGRRLCRRLPCWSGAALSRAAPCPPPSPDGGVLLVRATVDGVDAVHHLLGIELVVLRQCRRAGQMLTIWRLPSRPPRGRAAAAGGASMCRAGGTPEAAPASSSGRPHAWLRTYLDSLRVPEELRLDVVAGGLGGGAARGWDPRKAEDTKGKEERGRRDDAGGVAWAQHGGRGRGWRQGKAGAG